MEELIVVRRDSTLLPVSAEDEEKLRSFPIGTRLKAKITQPRSVPHNAFFHVFIQEVYPLWPKGHKFQPQNWEHLRAWLLCKVGHCRRVEVWVGDARVEVVRRFMQGLIDFHDGEDRYYWHWIEGEFYKMVRPLTLKFAEVDEQEFNLITEPVFKEIWEVTGIDVDEHHRAWLERNPGHKKRK